MASDAACGAPIAAAPIDALDLRTDIARLAAELTDHWLETERISRRYLRRDAKRLLRDANELHTAVTLAVVGDSWLGPAQRAGARIALRLSPYLRRRTKRAGVRAVLVSEMTRPGRSAGSRLGRAPLAATSRGRSWAPARGRHRSTGPKSDEEAHHG